MKLRMTFVLIHSPLVGLVTWSLVAEELRSRGYGVVTPELIDNGESPFWRQHVDAVVQACAAVADDEPIILAGHSAAGLLLPTIAAEVDRPVAGSLFVDAGFPIDGLSRLEVIDREDAALGRQFRDLLSNGGTFPNWTDADLASIVPDAAMRSALMQDLRPRALPFYTEPVPAPQNWMSGPAGYLQFGDSYDRTVARIDDWPVTKLAAGHFHQLVDPVETVDAMLDLVARMAIN